MNQFIRRHRLEITRIIYAESPGLEPMNDQTREEWIMNFEPLYLWAKRKGVKI